AAPKHPIAANVLMSASTPAPPDGSKPAIEITVSISRSDGRNRAFDSTGKVNGQPHLHGQAQSEILYVVVSGEIITSSWASAKSVPREVASEAPTIGQLIESGSR